MPHGKKSSVKLFQENPDKYELNTKSHGPTFIPKCSQKQAPCDINNPEHIDRSQGSPWQDFAHTSDDL